MLLLVFNLVAAAYMTGLIWFVQVVHYPQFADVPEAAWLSYHRRHARLTGWVTALPMVLELAAAGALVWWRGVLPAYVVWGSLGLAAATWLVTFGVSIPCHNRLGLGWDAAAARRLVWTNWFRTAAWTARTALLAWGMCG